MPPKAPADRSHLQGVKLALSAAAVAATLGGWAILSADQPRQALLPATPLPETTAPLILPAATQPPAPTAAEPPSWIASLPPIPTVRPIAALAETGGAAGGAPAPAAPAPAAPVAVPAPAAAPAPELRAVDPIPAAAPVQIPALPPPPPVTNTRSSR